MTQFSHFTHQGPKPAGHNLFWFDCETTDLDPRVGAMLEVAGVITDTNLVEVTSAEYLVRHDNLAELADKCPDCVFEMHKKDGLWADLARKPTTPLVDIDRKLRCLAEVNKCAARQSPLCGASIHFDRAWCDVHLPQLMGVLHYRNIDVSTLMQLVRFWRPEAEPPETEAPHRAMADIRRSIDLLRHYRDKVML